LWEISQIVLLANPAGGQEGTGPVSAVTGTSGTDSCAPSPRLQPTGSSRKPGSLHPTLRAACWGRQSPWPDHHVPALGRSQADFCWGFCCQAVSQVCLPLLCQIKRDKTAQGSSLKRWN